MRNYINDKYLKEYEKRTNAKELWKKHLKDEEKKQYNRYLSGVYICIAFIVIFSSVKVSRMQIHITVLDIVIMIGALLILLRIWKKEEDFSIRVKNRIAVEEYGLKSWKEKVDLEIEAIKLFLRNNNVKTEKQIEVALKSIEDEIAKKSKYNIVGVSSFSVFLLTVWNEQIKLMYKYQEPNNIWKLFIILVALLFIVWCIIIVLTKYSYDMKEIKISKLKGMKNILLEMYLEALGEE